MKEYTNKMKEYTTKKTNSANTIRVPLDANMLMNALLCVRCEGITFARYVFGGNSYCKEHYDEDIKRIYAETYD